MSLRKKTLLTIIITFAFFLIAVAVIARTVFLDSYLDLERRFAEENIRRIHFMLDYELNGLASLTSDWGAWDDTYAFMEDQDPDFIQSNMVDSTFEELLINALIILDNEGNAVYLKGFNLKEAKAAPFPQDFQEFLENNLDRFIFLTDAEPETGLTDADGIPLIFAASPILTSEEEGPSRGALIFAKYLEGESFRHLAASVPGDVSIIPYTSEINSGFSSGIIDGEKYFSDTSNPDSAVYLSLTNNINGEPNFYLRQEGNRPIYQQGIASTRLLIFSCSGAGILTGILALVLLEKGFLKRLTRLNDSVAKYREDGSGAEENILPGEDELALLSREINHTLKKLRESRSNLQSHLEMEELMVDISSRFINLPYDQIDEGIQQAIEEIGRFAEADRSYIILLKETNPAILNNTNEWCREGIPSVMGELQDLPVAPFRWWFDKIQLGESIVIPKIEDMPESARAEKELFLNQNIMSMAAVPLFIRNQMIGFLGFDALRQELDWSGRTLLLMEVISSIIANAIDRKRSERDIRLNQTYQYRLNEIIRHAIAEEDFECSMETLSKELRSLIGCSQSYVIISDNGVERIFRSGKEIGLNDRQRQYQEYLLQKAKKKVFVMDGNSPAKADLFLETDHFGEAFVAIPLSAKKLFLGLAVLVCEQPHRFSPLEIEICEQAGPQVTLALLKARALGRAERYSRELDALRATIADITSELELDRLLHTILKRAIRLLGADGGDFCIFKEAENELEVAASLNLDKDYAGTSVKLGEGAAGRAAVSRETIIIEDYAEWAQRMEQYEAAELRAAMVAPMVVGARLIGTVGIFHFSKEKKFSDEDRHLLEMFAQHAAIAMDNAMLFEKIQEMARTDPVTGLLNRRALMQIGEYEVARSERLDHPISVMMIDLDNFKSVNDTYSHNTGDEVLKDVGLLIAKNLRAIDILARYGGDEFTIIMPETNENDAFAAGERLRKMISEAIFQANGNLVHLTASIGVGSFAKDPPSLEEMIHSADQAMYRSKSGGKDRVDTLDCS